MHSLSFCFQVIKGKMYNKDIHKKNGKKTQSKTHAIRLRFVNKQWCLLIA